MSSTRSIKKRSNRAGTSRIKTLHQLLWLSGLLQASGLLSHEKEGTIARTKRPNHSKTYNDRAKTSTLGKIASLKKFTDPEKLGPYLYGRVQKGVKEREGTGSRRHFPAPPTQLPTVNELKALDEQLLNEMNKQTRRNQRTSVSHYANRSLRHSKQSFHNSTRKGKRGSISSRR